MRRAPVHATFALLTGALATSLVWQLVALQRVERDNRAIAAVPAVLEAGEASTAAGVDDDAPPRARLARAVALAAGGEAGAAEALFTELGRREDEVGRAARFDLANAYLRQGLDASDDPARARAIVELAKQRYRDLLREDPGDWDVRYNLERALRAAPEGEERIERERIPPVKSVDVVFPGFEAEDLP